MCSLEYELDKTVSHLSLGIPNVLFDSSWLSHQLSFFYKNWPTSTIFRLLSVSQLNDKFNRQIIVSDQIYQIGS